MKISCIIVSYARNAELKGVTLKCLETLRKTENRHTFEIIVVESQAGVTYPRADKMVKPTGPYNYNAYLNQGAQHATGRLLGFFNNDLIFYQGWSEHIVNALNDHPDLHSVSPWCGRSHPGMSVSRHTGNHWGRSLRRHVAGWAILIRADAYRELGQLDEGVEFHFSDDLYIAQMKQAGLNHALVTGARVDHLESRTLHSFDKQKIHDYTEGQKAKYLKRLKDRFEGVDVPKKAWQK